MKKSLSFLLIFIFSCSVYASKDRGVYVGGGFKLVNVGIKDSFSNTVHFKTVEVLLGYKYNPYLCFETRGGLSAQSEAFGLTDESGVAGSASASIDSYFSAYYRPEIANEIAKLYLLIGRTSISTSVEFEDSTSERISKASGWSYGAGFGMWLDERMNLNFEIKNLADTGGDSYTSFGVSADYRF